MKLKAIASLLPLFLAMGWALGQRTLSVPSQVVAPGSTVTVAVQLNDGNGIGGLQFELTFASTQLAVADTDGDGNLSEEVLRGSLLKAEHLMVTNAQTGRVSVVIAGVTSFNAGSGSVALVPLRILASSGVLSIGLGQVIASDPLGNALPIAVSGGTLAIQDTNAPPTAAPDAATLAEDTSVNILVLNNDSDPNGDPLSITGVGTPSHGSALQTGPTTVRYTPSLNYHGSDSFTYSISDGRGGTATGTVSITVTPVNDPPEAVADTASTTEDSPVNIAVLGNDTDPDGDALTVISTSSVVGGSISIQSGSTVRYAPNRDFNGAGSFNYTVSDGQGGTDSAAVTITVTPVNDSPTAVADLVETLENTPVEFNPVTNDTDVDGDSLTISSVTQGTHGSVVIRSPQILVYSPESDFSGSDQFTYRVSDGKGGIATGTVTVNITLDPADELTLIFPQFADGGEHGDSLMPNSSRIILRNHANELAEVEVLFRDATGALQPLLLVGEQSAKSVYMRTLAPRGVIELETAGSGVLKTGVVEVKLVEGDSARLRGALIFSLFGTFVSVPSSSPLPDHAVVVSLDADMVLGENTGVALYNPDPDRASSVNLSLRDWQGVQFATRNNVRIGPREQLLGFVTEDAFFGGLLGALPSPFMGTLAISVTNGPDVAALGMVQKRPSLNSALLAFSGGAASANRLYFPQFLNGGDSGGSPNPNSSRIVVRNGNEVSPETIQLKFFDSNGEPSPVPISGSEVSSLAKDVPPLGVTRVDTDGTGVLKAGVVELETASHLPVSGTLVYSTFGTFVSVANSSLRPNHSLIVSVNPDPVLGEDTGIAAFNPDTGASAVVRLVLRDANGNEVARRNGITIGPRKQFAGFITEAALFESYFRDRPSGPFLGSLEVIVTGGPGIAVLGLTQKKAEFNSALVATPVTGIDGTF